MSGCMKHTPLKKYLPLSLFLFCFVAFSSVFAAEQQNPLLPVLTPETESAPTTPKASHKQTTPDSESLTKTELSVIQMGREGIGADEQAQINEAKQTLKNVLLLLKDSTALSSIKLQHTRHTLKDVSSNLDTLVSQMENYSNSLTSLMQVLGDQPTPNEETAITKQRIYVQNGQRAVRASLVEAKLYQMQAHQLEDFTQNLLNKLHQQILTKRTFSPLNPAFWEGVIAEKSLSNPLIKDNGGLDMTILLFGGATATFCLILLLSHLLGRSFPKIFRAWAKTNIDVTLNAGSNLSIISKVFSPREADRKAKKLQMLEEEEKILLREELNAVPLGTLGQLLIGIICVATALILWNLWIFFIHGESCGLAIVVNNCLPACAFILGAGAPLLGWTRGMPRPISSFLMAISLVLASNLVGLLEREVIAPNLSAFLQGAVALLDAFSLSLLFRMKKAPEGIDSTSSLDNSDLTGRQKFEAILVRRWSVFHVLSNIVFVLTLIAITAGYMTLAFIINTQLLVLVYAIALVCLIVGSWKQMLALTLSPGRFVLRKLHALGLSQNRIDQMKVLAGAAGLVFLCALTIAICANGVHFSVIELYDRLEKIFLGALFVDIPISPKMILSCVLTLFCTYYGIQLACLWLTSRLFPTTQLSNGAQSSIITILTYTTWILSGIFCLTLLGVSVSSLTWVVSALSVGVGFGLQSIVKDFVSGIMLLAERPIQPGDTIEVSGASGEVKRIAMRATNIALPDGEMLIVPNSQFITSVVKNSTYNNNPNRMAIYFDFPTSANFAKINQIILKVAGLQKDILVSPPPSILTRAIYGGDMNFMLRFWYPSNGSSAKIKSIFLQALYAELEKEGEYDNVIIKG
ncbi:mechanosensitive ion channel [Acetobacteraceae bacterium]|nr:mechanosensitive ion channel [Acetobacteraceae bacterium]